MSKKHPYIRIQEEDEDTKDKEQFNREDWRASAQLKRFIGSGEDADLYQEMQYAGQVN